MTSYTVEVFDSGSGSYREIRLRGDRDPVKVSYGVSSQQLAPKAVVQTDAREDISPAQLLRVKDDSGDVVFEGATKSGGRRGRDGSRKVVARHDAYQVFQDEVSLSVSSPTDQDVLSAALSNADGGGSFTLDYNGTPISLADDYNVNNRVVRRVFDDIVSRTGDIYWIDIDNTVHVTDGGGGGLWKSVDTSNGSAVVQSYDDGDVDTVVNDVTVIGTGGESVEGNATDSTSINEYGRRPDTVNVDYIQTASEASAMASELLQPEPPSSAKLIATDGIGDITVPRINQTIDVTDTAGTGANETFVVIGQTIEQGQTVFELGFGSASNTEQFNRGQRSSADNSRPGSVYNTDRIADGAVESNKLVDSSVITSKLADLAVQLDKVDDGAIDTVKIKDDAIEAPKILAGTITANEIAADTLTANEITAGTITALEIAADTLTANEIDTLDLTTNELVVGTDTNNDIEFTEVDFDTAIVPETDGACQVGDDFDRFSNMFAVNMIADAGIFEGISIDDGGFEIKSKTFSNGLALVPEVDNENFIGSDSTNEAFASMAAHNFITSTPEPLSGVDAADITDYTWRQPPEYCAQRKATASDDCEYRHQNPDSGIDLPHITNYLFEVCKDQQSKIESLESTVDDLQSRLADLEAKQE